MATAVAPTRQSDSKRSTYKKRWAGFAKKVPRWRHGHVGRGNRLLRPAGLQEQKDIRQRHRSIVPVASTSDIGPVERAPGRRATAMVEDGICAVFCRTVPRWRGLSRMDRLQNAVPVAKGPGFLQLSVQLQGVLQPKVPSQKALHRMKKWGAETVLAFLRPLLRRNQYCNEGCKKSATSLYRFALQLFMQPYSRAKNNKENAKSINTKTRGTQKIG